MVKVLKKIFFFLESGNTFTSEHKNQTIKILENDTTSKLIIKRNDSRLTRDNHNMSRIYKLLGMNLM